MSCGRPKILNRLSAGCTLHVTAPLDMYFPPQPSLLMNSGLCVMLSVSFVMIQRSKENRSKKVGKKDILLHSMSAASLTPLLRRGRIKRKSAPKNTQHSSKRTQRHSTAQCGPMKRSSIHTRNLDWRKCLERKAWKESTLAPRIGDDRAGTSRRKRGLSLARSHMTRHQ